MTDPAIEAEVRRRQRSRAVLMAIGLFAFVILIYFKYSGRMHGPSSE